MASRAMSQSYVVELAYPGKKPIFFGNVICDAGVGEHEVMIAAAAKVDEHLPLGYELRRCIRGAVWFKADENA